MVMDLAEVPAGGSSLSFFSSGAAEMAAVIAVAMAVAMAAAMAAVTAAAMTAVAAAAADADLTVRTSLRHR